MFKLITIFLTLLSVLLTFLLLPLFTGGNTHPHVLEVQAPFLYGGEVAFGLLLSGVLCFGKSAFEPFHLLQIFAGAVYLICEILMLGFLFVDIGSDSLIVINSIMTFIFLSIIALSMLANYHSMQNREAKTKIVKV